jgi:hypothetical protein
MLTYINLFYKGKEIEMEIKSIEAFDNYSHSIDIEDMYQHNQDTKELKSILQKSVMTQRHKRVEFQNYIPFNSIGEKNYEYI